MSASAKDKPAKIEVAAIQKFLHLSGVRTLTPFCLLLLFRAEFDRGSVFEQVGVSVLDNVGKALMTKT
jgi:hypothetical protein